MTLKWRFPKTTGSHNNLARCMHLPVKFLFFPPSEVWWKVVCDNLFNYSTQARSILLFPISKIRDVNLQIAF